MRKIAILSGLLGIALLFASNSSSLQGYVDTLNGAKSVKADYTVNVIGGTKKSFSVELSKPNMARIDKENELIIADGKDILTYDKKAMTYYKRPQSDSEFAALFGDDFDGGFIRLDLKQQVAGFHGLPILFVPLQDTDFGDRFADARCFDLALHDLSASSTMLFCSFS